MLLAGRLSSARRCLGRVEEECGVLAGESDSNKTPRSLRHSSPSSRQQLTEPPLKRRRLAAPFLPQPCLRCKILKKRCDILDTCAHCPDQSFDIENEHWKVLGCFRGQPKDLASTFCPPFSRSVKRRIRYANGGVGEVSYVLTKSRVSLQKRARIWNLVRTRKIFAGLEDGAWSNVAQRAGLSSEATIVTLRSDGEVDGIDAETKHHEAAWAVLQMVSMEMCYLEKTAYNFFTLIRTGNFFSTQEPQAWELFTHTKRLLRQSVELYLLEKLCAQIAVGNMTGSPPFDRNSSTPKALVLVDLLEDVEDFLSKFDNICSQRAKLTGESQIACFYALLVFGIAKSILIDAYSVRPEYEEPNFWNQNESTKIVSAYKALVSVFCWASKSDVMLQNGPSMAGTLGEAIKAMKTMLRFERWAERGVRGTKDFLLGLGSCYYADGGYNGFFVQKYGREKLQMFVGRSGENRPPGQTLSRQSEDGMASPMVHTFAVEVPLGQSPSASESTLEGSTSSSPKIIFVDQDSPKGKSRRKKALDAATRENAREMRKIGACWNCWAMKVTCSEGFRCTRCQNNDGVKGYRFCNRGAFSRIFTDLIIPDFLDLPFTPQETKDYIDTNTCDVSDLPVEIEVLRGEVPMKLQVHIFTPALDGIVCERYSSPTSVRPLGVESLPIGITENLELLEGKCLQQLKEILNRSSFLSQLPGGKAAPHLMHLMQILMTFHTETKIMLVENSLLLYLAICTTTYPIMLTDSSALTILERLGSTAVADIVYSSRILNRQIKHAMFNLCRRLTTQVLADLEKVLRTRSKSSWPILFTTLTLLCFSIEGSQLMIHSHVKSAKFSDFPLPRVLEREPQRSCRALEDMPFGQLVSVFHTLYRTSKGGSGGFSPFRDGFEDRYGALSPAASLMVRRIREEVLNEDGIEVLKGKDGQLDFEDEYHGFAERSSGRLVSKFLLSIII